MRNLTFSTTLSHFFLQLGISLTRLLPSVQMSRRSDFCQVHTLCILCLTTETTLQATLKNSSFTSADFTLTNRSIRIRNIGLTFVDQWLTLHSKSLQLRHLNTQKRKITINVIQFTIILNIAHTLTSFYILNINNVMCIEIANLQTQ